jgi:uncharacterized protein YciI
MMRVTTHWLRVFVRLSAVVGLSITGLAQAQLAASAPAVDSSHKLFAVEFKVGARWVTGRAPHEQEYFREHSANLRKLREHGSLIMGARYGDKGLVVLSAESESAARAMVEQDPSVKNGTFSYDLHEFSVFYGGSVQPQLRKQ